MNSAPSTDPYDRARALTFGDVLTERARSLPDRTATVCGTHRSTWSELDARVDRLSAVMRDVGVGVGDVVLWIGQNCHRCLESILAAARIGAILCPVNWRQTEDELVFALHDAEPRLVLWQNAEIGDRVRAARATATSTAAWIQHDGPTDLGEYEELLAVTEPMVDTDLEVDDESPVIMIYTAAFDGRPNGALLSHRAWIVQNVITAMVQQYDDRSVYLNCGPMFHVGTLRHTLAIFQQGGTNVVVPRIEARELCEIIERERCSGAFLERPTIDQLIAVNSSGAYDISSLRAASGPPEWNAMVTLDDRPITNGFGQSELAGVVTFGGICGPHIGGAGHPSPVAQIAVVDAESVPVPVGVIGELVVRGPVVMNGYHRRPELNVHRSRGGWHHTNDLARRETDGSLTFVGPASRIVKSASENIYPAEVEGCLAQHSAVAAVGVIGTPDATWGQSVVAIVELNAGANATAETLIDHCRAHIASYKKPKRIEFVTNIARTARGSVDYEALDAEFGGGGYPSK